MLFWLSFIYISLFRLKPLSDFIFFQTSDVFMLSFIVDVKVFHDSFLLFFIKNLVLALCFLNLMKFSGVLFFLNGLSALFLLVTASFILSFHQGTLGFLVLLVVAIVFFCGVDYEVCENLCSFFYIYDIMVEDFSCFFF